MYDCTNIQSFDRYTAVISIVVIGVIWEIKIFSEEKILPSSVQEKKYTMK